jgi:glycosyltransferase involved in cell wall biosynthesis
MRVLLLIKTLQPGGAERLLVDVVRHLDREQASYEVAFVRADMDEAVGELEALGLPVHCLGAAWPARLRRLVRTRQIDLVHAHSPLLAAAARVVLPGGVRLVYTEHGMWGSYHPATHWANLVTYWRNDHVFAVSDEVHRSIRYPRLLRRLPMPPLETLHHGVEVPTAQNGAARELRAELGIPVDAPVVGSIGGFRREKGHRDLLQAARHVLDAEPSARFVLVGTGPLEAEVREQARRLGLDGHVAFAGYRSNAAHLIEAFDLFALSSHSEGLPVSLMEAMARGRAAVATSVGGVPELVEHGHSGWLVPPAEPEELAEAIVSLLRDVALRERLGRGALERAAAFDIRAAARKVEAVYEALV